MNFPGQFIAVYPLIQYLWKTAGATPKPPFSLLPESSRPLATPFGTGEYPLDMAIFCLYVYTVNPVPVAQWMVQDFSTPSTQRPQVGSFVSRSPGERPAWRMPRARRLTVTDRTSRTCHQCGALLGFYGHYPLVNIQKTMENHHFSWENPL